jgi:hypothetical protein
MIYAALSAGDAMFFLIVSVVIAVWGIWSMWMQTFRTEDWIRLQQSRDERRRQKRERPLWAIKGLWGRRG